VVNVGCDVSPVYCEELKKGRGTNNQKKRERGFLRACRTRRTGEKEKSLLYHVDPEKGRDGGEFKQRQERGTQKEVKYSVNVKV